MIQLCNLISPDKVVERYVIIIGKLYCRPERDLALARFVAAVDGQLHIEQFGDILLRFVVIFTQIADASVYEHNATSQIFCNYYTQITPIGVDNSTERCYNNCMINNICSVEVSSY